MPVIISGGGGGKKLPTLTSSDITIDYANGKITIPTQKATNDGAVEKTMTAASFTNGLNPPSVRTSSTGGGYVSNDTTIATLSNPTITYDSSTGVITAKATVWVGNAGSPASSTKTLSYENWRLTMTDGSTTTIKVVTE